MAGLFDLSILRTRPPVQPSFAQSYKFAQNLRELADRRRIQEQQMQLGRLRLEQEQREAEDEQRTRRILSTAPISDKTTLTDLLRMGIPLPAATKIDTDLRLRGTAATQQRTAELGQAKSEREAQTAQLRHAADVQYGLLQLPPEEREGAAWESAITDLTPPFVPSQGQMLASQAGAYGADKAQALQAAEATAAREKTKGALQISEEQLKQAVATAPLVKNQETYTPWRNSLPAHIRAQLPEQYSSIGVRMVERMGVPAAQREPSGVGDWVRIATDPSSTPEEQKQADEALIKHGEQAKKAAPQMILSADQKVGNEAKLRDDFRAESKNHITLRDAWGKIQGAAQSQTGAGDMSLIFAYMKILDPGSTVREGEYATAQNAGSIPERVTAMYNRAIKGEKLDPNVRAQFVEEAAKIYGQSEADHDKIRNIYRGIAQRSNLDPDNVVVDYSPGVAAPRPKAAKPAAPQGARPRAEDIPNPLIQPGEVAVKAPDGKTYYFPNKAEADAFKKRGKIP